MSAIYELLQLKSRMEAVASDQIKAYRLSGNDVIECDVCGYVYPETWVLEDDVCPFCGEKVIRIDKED